jgi:hypothetical protein
MVYTGDDKNPFSRAYNPTLPALERWFATRRSPGAGENGLFCGEKDTNENRSFSLQYQGFPDRQDGPDGVYWSQAIVCLLIGRARQGGNHADNEDVDR